MAHILLADDDQATRDLVARALAADGHNVAVTQDGLEALERLSRGGVEVLVSDVHMPGLDGLSLAAMATKANPKLRVLLMSGFPEELAKANAISANIAVLAKPFALEQLRSKLKALLA